MKKDDLPTIIGPDDVSRFENIPDADVRAPLIDWGKKASTGRPFFEGNSKYRDIDVNNIWFSECFNCADIAIWIYNQLVYPQRGEATPVNPDLPDEIRRDYDEASAISDLSPRGSAALLRLGIQKLCKHLGQPGRNINDDIKALVAAGLDTRVQRALDALRVIGNEAVHPGQIDLRDDRAMAEGLFRLMKALLHKSTEGIHVVNPA